MKINSNLLTKLTSTKVANRRGNFLFRQIAINKCASLSIEPKPLAFWRVKSPYHSVLLRNHHTTAVSPKMLPECTDVISKFERLPKIAKPRNYKLHLKPSLKEFTFEGEVVIEMEILKSTDHVKLYADDLKIKKASLTTSNNECISDVSVDLNEKEECVTLRFPKEVRAGLAHLSITYDGNLNDKMKGFYRSKYKNSDGEDDYMATTQFESTFARKAFPCFDEPGYKATFDVTLTVPKTKTALSNMNEISEKDLENGWKTIQYATTPLMSSYLVAFIVGDFEYVEGYTSDNVRVRIYTLPGKKYQGEFALQVAIKALPFFSKFFGVSYGLPKCDLIAIPDFNFGAMENWGLVTYREVYLLLDPAVSSSFGKEHIALVVAHELAHMWFGNLTTMEWWTDLWLKEGYATWMEYYFVNDAFPDFDIFTQFLTAEALRAMSLDALKNSHPVEVPINNPNEIEDIYDAVSYSKSASLIRMLHDYLDDNDFRAGLQNYLSKYSFKNTITQNLWDSLTEKSGKNVAGLMSTWTRKMGFPLIKAKTTFEEAKCILHLDQKRFLADGSEDDDSTTWHVPITIATSSKSNPIIKYLLTQKSDSLTLDRVSANDWIKLNSGFTGFYKVQYSEQMLEKLITSIKGGHLKPHDRLNLCGDLFSLVRCGKMSTTEFLNLLVVYKNETDYTVWSEIDAAIDVIDNCLQHTDSGESFRRFCCSIYEQEANRLGWEPKLNEGHTVGLLRPLLLKRLGKFGDKKTIEKARLMFRNLVDEGKDMEPDLRSMVFGLIGTYNGEKGQNELLKIFESSDFSEVQRQCLVAIGRSSDVDIQKKCLEYTFGKDKVRLQDSYLVVAGLATTVSGQDTIWQYFRTNMRQLIKKFGSPNSALFGHVIKMVTSYHCSEGKAKEIEEFFKENEDVMTAANRPIKQSLETIYLNSDLLRRDKDAIEAWLAKN